MAAAKPAALKGDNTMKTFFRITLGAMLGAALMSSAAVAEDSAVPLGPQPGYFDMAWAQVSTSWRSAEHAVSSWFHGGVPTSIVTKQFVDTDAPTELDFQSLMSLAGYSGLQMKATLGVIPRFSTTFALKRQMSESDRFRLLRLLRKHQRAFSGPVAMAERLIVYSVLEVNSSDYVELDKIVVNAFPLPYAEFLTGPKSSTGLGPEAAHLSQQIEDLKVAIEGLK